MKLKKFRWSKVYESSEEELVEFLKNRNITAKQWVLESDDIPLKNYLDKETTYWCAEGAFKLWVDGETVSMQPGDSVKIPANSSIQIEPGMFASIVYESN